MFQHSARQRIDDYVRVWAPFLALDVWLLLRLQFLSSLIQFLSATLLLWLDSTPSTLGLIMNFVIQITAQFNVLVQNRANLEADITSTERVLSYVDLEPEERSDEKAAVPLTWLRTPVIQFKSFTMGYQPNQPPCLRDINITINAGDHIAVVDRTGAGKSSFALALLRAIDSEAVHNGKIVVDGQDISSLRIDDVRQRITLWPQEAPIFRGTLRDNVDPSGMVAEERIRNIVNDCLIPKLFGMETNPNPLELQINSSGMAHAFGTVPKGAAKQPEKYTLRVPDEEIDDFKKLLALSKIGPETFYNRQEDRQFGVTRKWLIEAKDAWLNYDWRKREDRINSFPNFKAKVDHKEIGTTDLHFVGLFSSKPDALPVIFMHGWPGSFLEFLPMLDLILKKYTPETLPYHIIVPSLTGYGLSASSAPLDKEITVDQVAGIMHQLMLDLGFGSGYAAQGGDVGSFLARFMSANYKECKAVHLNMLYPSPDDQPGSTDDLTAEEQKHTQHMLQWRTTGMSYALEHGLRPATIGLVLSASPISLLAWIGEKYLEWVDNCYPLQLETILDLVSLYWFTSTFPRSIYPYRALAQWITAGSVMPIPTSKEIPLGYSFFPSEVSFMPKAWAEKTYPNLKFYRTHEKGGHFAALEQPELLLQDVEDFLKSVKATSKI
ncbi:epoxide hydrolase [Colletotrichum karsti]|uniref:Epoxide hydrolase n=1 Tax=Colletotrichum karsti TaxID=1095194 RepID=A0A9P6I658_9PEZI|nr:epoxide hydrolase [Colletotrichum karsti]KAF9877098.1 epoxide hydrolase [Colletotrichum karsti]